MSGVVLKAGDSRAMTRGLCSLDLRDFARSAEDMVAAARAEAQRIVQEARLRAESERAAVRQQAHRQGYEGGMTEGRAAGEAAALAEARERFAKEQQALLAALRDLLERFQAQREQLYLAARRDVVVLAVAVARRIVSGLDAMGEAAPEAALAAAQEAMDLVGKATEALIRVHPADRQALEKLAKDVQNDLQSSRHVRLVEDAAVGRGGVIVETAEGSVDARAMSRVERIADELVTDWRQRVQTLRLAG